MKASTLLFVLLFTVTALSQDTHLELLRTDLKANKVAMITEVMQFTEEEANLFWPIYREYGLELSKLGDQRLALIKDYSKNYESMTDDKAKELVEKTFKLQEQQTDLLKKYFKKVDKVLTTTRAAEFLQLENQILLLLEFQVASVLPPLEKAVTTSKLWDR